MYKEVYSNESDIVQLYKSGMSTKEIAQKYGCKSTHPISAIIARNNIGRNMSERMKVAHAQGKFRGSYIKKQKRTLSETEIVNHYLKGNSLNDIAHKAHVCFQTIDKILKKNNIKKRTTSESVKLLIQNGTHRTPWKPMEQHCSWKGGRIEDKKHGYVRIKAVWHPRANKKGYMFEHIVVCEQKIGRYLEPGEVVHHINGIRNDNRPENLINLPERVHASISGKQAIKAIKLKDVLQQKIRELEQEIMKLKIDLMIEDERSNDTRLLS